MRLDLAVAQELYLASLGYSQDEIKGATNRAIGQAERLARRLPSDMQERAFESLLAQELAQCVAWLDSQRLSALESDLHTERYAQGLEEVTGVKPGKNTVESYRKSMQERG